MVAYFAYYFAYLAYLIAYFMIGYPCLYVAMLLLNVE